LATALNGCALTRKTCARIFRYLSDFYIEKSCATAVGSDAVPSIACLNPAVKLAVVHLAGPGKPRFFLAGRAQVCGCPGGKNLQGYVLYENNRLDHIFLASH
jgi:hypothetical protein